MPEIDHEKPRHFAKRYIWWQSPDVAINFPERIVARVMNIGDYKDVQALGKQVGDDYLREVLIYSEVGQFNARSWHYWHSRLRLASQPDDVPLMPTRRLE